MFEPKTVLITGITGGIGKAMAIEFAGAGWNILGHYYSQDEKAYEFKAEVERKGVRINLLQADFSKETDINRFIDCLKAYRIDSLINNAGTYVVSRHFSELSGDEFNAVFMVNVFAPMKIAAAVFEPMRKRKFGRIINISSIAAKYGGANNSLHYGAAKRALEGVTKTLAREGASDNVFVNTVRPGLIDTEFHKKFPKDMAKRVSMVPLKKMGMPEDIAGIVYYLGSDRNNFITDEIITVAGGE